MSEELKRIVTKIITDHPEVEAVYSNWKPNGVGGLIFIQIPNTSHDVAVDLQNTYTQYVWDEFEYMSDDIRSAVIVTEVGEMELLYKPIYNKSLGGFIDAV